MPPPPPVPSLVNETARKESGRENRKAKRRKEPLANWSRRESFPRDKLPLTFSLDYFTVRYASLHHPRRRDHPFYPSGPRSSSPDQRYRGGSSIRWPDLFEISYHRDIFTQRVRRPLGRNTERQETSDKTVAIRERRREIGAAELLTEG